MAIAAAFLGRLILAYTFGHAAGYGYRKAREAHARRQLKSS